MYQRFLGLRALADFFSITLAGAFLAALPLGEALEALGGLGSAAAPLGSSIHSSVSGSPSPYTYTYPLNTRGYALYQA